MGELVMTYNELRQEFTRNSFRRKLLNKLGNKCVNCGGVTHIEYHHIVPLSNGGTNKLSNIVPLCVECHYNAHKKTNADGIKKAKDNGTIGRKHKMTYEECEPFLRQYFNLEIGKKECSEKCMYSSPKRLNDSPYVKRFKKENNIPSNFYNNIDLLNAQSKRLGTSSNYAIK